MSRIVYHIENRGASYIFHWYLYMVSGLRHIINGTPSIGEDGSGAFEQNLSLLGDVNDTIPYNIYFHNEEGHFSMKYLKFQKETMELLKTKFKVVNEILPDDIIINNYGERILNNEYHISCDGYNFLRNLGENLNITKKDIDRFSDKCFYLSRNNSHLLSGNNGTKRRHVINETELLNEVSKYGVELLYLEDLSVVDKIKLFKLAKLIISPGSGGLTFTLFSTNCIIIELGVSAPHQIDRAYSDICRYYNIPYDKFICRKVDSMDNMEINIVNFSSYLYSKLNS